MTEKGREEFFGIGTVGKSPEQIELEWFENYYNGDIPQLTVRAVLFSAALGVVMSLSNLYVGLKTGWGLGVAITACILSFSIGAALKKIGILRTNLSILENNCMQSTASSAEGRRHERDRSSGGMVPLGHGCGDCRCANPSGP